MQTRFVNGGEKRVGDNLIWSAIFFEYAVLAKVESEKERNGKGWGHRERADGLEGEATRNFSLYSRTFGCNHFLEYGVKWNDFLRFPY